ncbi:MAG: FMN-binding protein [Pseudomonadota bacterium]
MKEILKITASLTGVCVAAALILGAVYTQTKHAREAIEKREKNHVVQELLGYGGGRHAPSDLEIHMIHRYVINDPKAGTLLGYVVPAKGEKSYLVTVDLTGKPVKALELKAKPKDIVDVIPCDMAIKAVLTDGASGTYADSYYIAVQSGKQVGYVLPGVTQGFKTFIKLMVSMDSQFTVTGIAITSSEEDPGLGAEIKQDYFRNQFAGKTQDVLKKLEVDKKPLPDDYQKVLEPERTAKAGLTPDQINEIKKKHLKDNIYALTGATISSRAVTKGVQDTVRKFVYRFDILKNAAREQNVQTAF